MRLIAEKYKVGFLDASADEGAILFPYDHGIKWTYLEYLAQTVLTAHLIKNHIPNPSGACAGDQPAPMPFSHNGF